MSGHLNQAPVLCTILGYRNSSFWVRGASWSAKAGSLSAYWSTSSMKEARKRSRIHKCEVVGGVVIC